jgi:hypothetical protein
VPGFLVLSGALRSIGYWSVSAAGVVSVLELLIALIVVITTHF